MGALRKLCLKHQRLINDLRVVSNQVIHTARLSADTAVVDTDSLITMWFYIVGESRRSG